MTTTIGTPLSTGGSGDRRTYLELVQRLARECRISRHAPDSVQNQSGTSLSLCEWIATAWDYIQTRHREWGWKRSSVSFVTEDGKAIYTPVDAGIITGPLSRWEPHSFRAYQTTTGFSSELPLTYMDYPRWRDLYQIGLYRTQTGWPRAVTVTPERSIGLGPTPSAGYTIVGEYTRGLTRLRADDDKPDLPDGFDDMIIVYRAMLHVAGFHAASEIYQRGLQEYTILMNDLEREYLPTSHCGVTPLA